MAMIAFRLAAEVRVWSKWLTVVVFLHINRLDDGEGMIDSQKL
jgi:hypothetical protein